MQRLTLSITQLNNYIKQIFDNEELLLGVSVYGEVTNFKISNGIAYFDIKEEGAQLSCVKFSTFAPFAKNGDQVIVTGRLNYHTRLGKLSFVVSSVESYGMGELYKRYLELKERLEKEGLFDASKKKPIPTHAKVIGVVTSETGAVIRDIYHVTRAKNPLTNILVYPAKVQGERAEKEIAEGIEYFNKAKNVDVIIVARGGGSFEDLAPFNTELLARAIYKSELPVISAVGHETDFSISDFVSDLRAPTPSVAAELAVYNYYEEMEYLMSIKERLSGAEQKLVLSQFEKLTGINRRIVEGAKSKIEVARLGLVNKSEKIYSLISSAISVKQNSLNMLASKIEKSSPLTILKQGYAKVMKGGRGVSLSGLSVGDEIETYLSGGKVESKITKITEEQA